MRIFYAICSKIFEFILIYRHYLYDNKIIRSHQSPIKTICIGNLNMGGSGKTPFIIYLAKNLSKDYKVAILSRGYKRKKTGFQIVNLDTEWNLVGDEPKLIKETLPNITVAVCENRFEGCLRLQKMDASIDLILLDDAMQHRNLKPDLTILLTRFKKPFFNDELFPLGTLRDLKCRAKNADFNIITKCPEIIKEETKPYFIKSIKEYNSKPIFFSKYKYAKIENIYSFKLEVMPNEIILLTGLANASELVRDLSEKTTIIKHFEFADHYEYSYEDIEKMIKEVFNLNISFILTTTKDAVKLKHFEKLFENHKITICTINIDIEIDDGIINEINNKIKADYIIDSHS
jgi:tetraacyldisaccharide 4'-kinase